MGAESFCVVTRKTSAGDTVQSLFLAAIQKARHLEGHGGYTGTIAEKDSFISCSDTPLASEDEAIALASKLLNDADSRVYDKWGPAGAIPFSDTPTSRTVKIKVRVERGQSPYLAAPALAREQVKLREGEVITRVHLNQDTLSKKYLHDVAASKGRAVTRYALLVNGHLRDQELYASQAEARAAAKAMVTARPSLFHSDELAVEVIGVTRRDTGEALVTATRKLAYTEADVTVEIGKRQKSSPVAGWVFCGYASS